MDRLIAVETAQEWDFFFFLISGKNVEEGCCEPGGEDHDAQTESRTRCGRTAVSSRQLTRKKELDGLLTTLILCSSGAAKSNFFCLGRLSLDSAGNHSVESICSVPYTRT